MEARYVSAPCLPEWLLTLVSPTAILFITPMACIEGAPAPIYPLPSTVARRVPSSWPTPFSVFSFLDITTAVETTDIFVVCGGLLDF